MQTPPVAERRKAPTRSIECFDNLAPTTQLAAPPRHPTPPTTRFALHGNTFLKFDAPTATPRYSSCSVSSPYLLGISTNVLEYFLNCSGVIACIRKMLSHGTALMTS